MKMENMTHVAAAVLKREGLKKPMKIGDAKEFLRCLRAVLNENNDASLIWAKYRLDGPSHPINVVENEVQARLKKAAKTLAAAHKKFNAKPVKKKARKKK